MRSSWGPQACVGEAGLYTLMGILSPVLSSILHVPNPELGPRGAKEQTQGVICRVEHLRIRCLLGPHSRTFGALQAFSELGPK